MLEQAAAREPDSDTHTHEYPAFLLRIRAVPGSSPVPESGYNNRGYLDSLRAFD
jgi:hypothetical protein